MSWPELVAILAEAVGQASADRVASLLRARLGGCRVTIPSKRRVTCEEVERAAPDRAPGDQLATNCRRPARVVTRVSFPFSGLVGVPNGIRTRVATLKGWCPRPSRRWGRERSNGASSADAVFRNGKDALAQG